MQEKDAIEIYENGKHRRYALLFAVNGGAFAVARLLAGQPADVGGLTQGMLSAGMAAFTIVMAYDIWQFGLRMRAENGRWAPMPVEDPARLDARRRRMGLPPMAEYIKMMEEAYGAPPSD